ncbi:MAG: hypothetical protein LBH72_04180 [Proteiniphilum sp.]|jgi:hypothetical protein|nr:hypothetical protein [Proteiniphilum sp.]
MITLILLLAAGLLLIPAVSCILFFIAFLRALHREKEGGDDNGQIFVSLRPRRERKRASGFATLKALADSSLRLIRKKFMII